MKTRKKDYKILMRFDKFSVMKKKTFEPALRIPFDFI